VRAGRALTKKRITTRATALFSGVTFASPLAALTARRLTPDDVVQAVALTADAGWNQIDADWRMMLDLGDGVGLFDGGTLVATAIVLPYDRPVAANPKFAWISMVLVTKAWQRKGLARWMLERCVAALQGAGYTPMLDATPAGREVYLKLGFVEGAEILRHVGKKPAALQVGSAPPQIFRWITPDTLNNIAAMDATVFAANRLSLLTALSTRIPMKSYFAHGAKPVAGFAMIRDGRHAAHIGPIVADDVGTAANLVTPMLLMLDAPAIIIDAFAHQTDFVKALAAAGYEVQRKLTRMHLGPKAPAVARERYFAIAGPELG
jgi:GNAT superfamily N-acetyltransferase